MHWTHLLILTNTLYYTVIMQFIVLSNDVYIIVLAYFSHICQHCFFFTGAYFVCFCHILVLIFVRIVHTRYSHCLSLKKSS